MDRVPGGIADWSHCICDACQPYSAIITSDHRCAFCGGSFEFLTTDPQVRIDEDEAERRMKISMSLFHTRRSDFARAS